MKVSLATFDSILYGGKIKMEMEEIVKLIVVVIVLVIMVGATIFLLKGKGGALLDGIKNLLRFGR